MSRDFGGRSFAQDHRSEYEEAQFRLGLLNQNIAYYQEMIETNLREAARLTQRLHELRPVTSDVDDDHARDDGATVQEGLEQAQENDGELQGHLAARGEMGRQ